MFGGYTRLDIIGNTSHPADIEPDYDREKRSWLSRWLWGRSFARVLTVKATLSRPQLTQTITLASTAHRSNKQVGETWDTGVDHRRALTPFFRIDADTTVSVEVTISANAKLDSTAATGVLDLLHRATALIAPQATLVTALNQASYGAASSFVDQSLASLFDQSITEHSIGDIRAADWHAGAPLVGIVAYFPTGNGLHKVGSLRPVGGWDIEVEQPVVSIFSDVPFDPSDAHPPAQVCASHGLAADELQACTAYVALSPQAVMQFPVAESRPLVDVLNADSAIAKETQTLLSAPTMEGDRSGSSNADSMAAENPDVMTLCMLVSNKAEQLGFNRFDAAAILWAYSWQLPTARGGSALRADGECPAQRLAHRLLVSAPGSPPQQQTAER